jgi:hypothetical protein
MAGEDEEDRDHRRRDGGADAELDQQDAQVLTVSVNSRRGILQYSW